MTDFNVTSALSQLRQEPGVQIKMQNDDVLQGVQAIIRFPNNWGASVIRNKYSHGVELAVIRFESDDIDDFDLRYDTGVTADTEGWLDEETLAGLLLDIKLLHPDRQSIPGRRGTNEERGE